MINLRVHGVAKTLSPLHFASAIKWRVSQKGRAFPEGAKSGDGLFPLTRNEYMPIGFEPQGDDGNAVLREVPVVLSNSIRGRLRRACADLVEAAMRENGLRFRNLGEYNVLRCGCAHGHPDTAVASTSEREMARRNLVFGIFGGGPRMHPSPLVTWELLPVTDETVAAGMVRVSEIADAGVEPVPGGNLKRLTRFYHSRRIDEIIANPERVAEMIDPDSPVSLEDWFKVVATLMSRDAAERENDAKSKEEGSGTFSYPQGMRFHEVIVPGVPMRFRAEAALDNEAQAGLLLRGIERLTTIPLGGYARLGYGRLDWDLVVSVDDGAPMTLGAAVDRFGKACDEGLASFSVDEFSALSTDKNCKGWEKFSNVLKGKKKAGKEEEGAA